MINSGSIMVNDTKITIVDTKVINSVTFDTKMNHNKDKKCKEVIKNKNVPPKQRLITRIVLRLSSLTYFIYTDL